MKRPNGRKLENPNGPIRKTYFLDARNRTNPEMEWENNPSGIGKLAKHKKNARTETETSAHKIQRDGNETTRRGNEPRNTK